MLEEFDLLEEDQARNPGCKGYSEWTAWGYEFDCEYPTK